MPVQNPPFTYLRSVLALALAALLSGCVMRPTQDVWALDFRRADNNFDLQPARLLLDQRVPGARLVSVATALKLAPPGSLILACWRGTAWENFYGPCAHVARKIDDAHLAETFLNGGAGVYPLSRLQDRYAVIVLDVGARQQHLSAMRAEVHRLMGRPYDLSNRPGTYYCSNYQNRLQEVAGLPRAIPWNATWHMELPADVLLSSQVKVLWVGVNGAYAAGSAWLQ